MNKKTKRPTLKEVRAKEAEIALCDAREILANKWRPLAWKSYYSKIPDPLADALWECIEKSKNKFPSILKSIAN